MRRGNTCLDGGHFKNGKFTQVKPIAAGVSLPMVGPDTVMAIRLSQPN